MTRWRRTIAHVATEEMLHLALVQNLLSAIGAAPHLSRPNLPAPAQHYPAGVHLALVPFGEQALRHFMFLERPEGMELEGATGIDAPRAEAVPLMADGDIVPRCRTSPPSGTCTGRSRHGLAHLAEKFGERKLFVGPPRAQATSALLRLAGAGGRHRPRLGPASDRRDPRAGRGPARALGGRALRPVRRDPRRVPAAARGEPGLRPGPAGDLRDGAPRRARRRGPADRRSGDGQVHGPVQRQLRDPAADAGALLRAHRGDRCPARDAGQRGASP